MMAVAVGPMDELIGSRVEMLVLRFLQRAQADDGDES